MQVHLLGVLAPGRWDPDRGVDPRHAAAAAAVLDQNRNHHPRLIQRSPAHKPGVVLLVRSQLGGGVLRQADDLRRSRLPRDTVALYLNLRDMLFYCLGQDLL